MLHSRNALIALLAMVCNCMPLQVLSQSFEDIENQLFSELKVAHTAQDSVDIFNDLAYNYRRRSPKDILFYANLAIELSEAHNYVDGLGVGYKNKGIAYYKMQKPRDSTLLLYQKAVDYASRANDYYTQAACYNNIGLIQSEKMEYNQAIKTYLKGIKLFDEKLENKRLLSLLIGNMGAAYQDQGEYQKARGYYEQALNLLENQENNLSTLIYFYRGLSASYLETGDLDKAVEYLDKSIPLQEELGDYQSMVQTEQRYASIRLKQNRPLDALAHAEKAYNLAIKNELDINYSSSLLILSKIYFALDDLKRAEEYAQLAYNNKSESDHFSKDEYLSVRQLAEIHVAKNDYKTAYEYMKIASTIDSKRKNAQLQSVTKEVEAEYENEERLRAINQLQLEAKRSNNQIKYLTGFLLLIGSLLILSINLYRNKNKIASTIDQQNKEITLQSIELQRLNELKDKLFSIISHDLKSPVASLENSLTLLLSKELSSSEFMSFAKELKGETKQLRKTIDELMNWSYMQMIGLHPNPSHIKLKDSVDKAIAFYKSQSNEKNITIDNKITSDISLYTDEEHLNSILRNLISNGIKFSHPNNIITISGCRDKDRIAFHVKDEGVGIAKENLEHIFDIGFTDWGTAGEKGTGLGLPLCKEFVEKNGGTIKVASTLGKGSTFTVSLPSNEKCL